MRRPGERRQDPVAERLDDLTAVARDSTLSGGEVSSQQRRPFAVPQLGRPLSRADQIGEQDRRQHPIGDRLRGRTGDESLDPRGEAIDVEPVDEDGVARDLLVDRTLDQIRELPLRLLRHVRVDGSKHQRRRLHEREHVGDVARQGQAEETLDLHRGRRCADVAGDLASSSGIAGQRRGPDVKHRIGPGHVGDGGGDLVGHLRGGDRAAACRRADRDQPRDPVGMGGGQNRQRPARLDPAEQERAAPHRPRPSPQARPPRAPRASGPPWSGLRCRCRAGRSG